MKYKQYSHIDTTSELLLNEHMMYGSSRLGTYATNEFINDTLPEEINLPANQRFELTDHLGTVRAVVTGKKTNGEANILSLTDYYPYGMDMPGRVFTGENYRFGYQGSERDREILGGNAYTTFFRMLDPRLGRWFSPDPKVFPWQSPYTSMDNSPISLIDPFGASTEGDPLKPGEANKKQSEGNIKVGDVVKTNSGYYEYQVEDGFGNWVKIDYSGNPGTIFNFSFTPDKMIPQSITTNVAVEQNPAINFVQQEEDAKDLFSNMWEYAKLLQAKLEDLADAEKEWLTGDGPAGWEIEFIIGNGDHLYIIKDGYVLVKKDGSGEGQTIYVEKDSDAAKMIADYLPGMYAGGANSARGKSSGKGVVIRRKGGGYSRPEKYGNSTTYGGAKTAASTVDQGKTVIEMATDSVVKAESESIQKFHPDSFERISPDGTKKVYYRTRYNDWQKVGN